MKRILIALVKFYRVAISPYRPPCCNYTPTCSQYALEAIEKYGALKGGYLAFGAFCAATRFTREDMIRCPDPGRWLRCCGGRPSHHDLYHDLEDTPYVF